MKEYPFVSIIVLNFNGKAYLKECFESVERLNYPKDRFEIMMGDNASTDDSIDYMQKNFPWVKVIRFDQNYGFCKSNNLCAQQAKGEYLVFLNNDTFVEKDWLIHMVRGVTSEPGILSCACKMLFPHLEGGKVINAVGGVIFPDGGGLYLGWMDQDSPQYDREKFTAFGCGAGVLIQRKFFIETGGWDEYYFYSREEMDLGLRVWLHGYKVLYVPSAVMYHYMGRTGFRGRGIKITPAIEFLVHRNDLYFMLKHYELPTIIKGLPFFIARSVRKVLYALLHGNVRIPLALGKAYLHILKDMPKILRARKQVQAARKLSDQELNKLGLLVNVREMIRMYCEGLNRMRKYYSGGFYDTEDAVAIQTNEKGEFTFSKP